MSVNKVILLGFCGKDPEIRHLDGGVSVAKFTLATSEKYKNKSGETVDNTEWHSIVAWRGLADVCERWIRKGSQLYVEGKITNRSYEDKDGVKKYFTEIVADNIRMLGGKKDAEPAPQQDYNRTVSQAIDNSAHNELAYPESGADDLPF